MDGFSSSPTWSGTPNTTPLRCTICKQEVMCAYYGNCWVRRRAQKSNALSRWTREDGKPNQKLKLPAVFSWTTVRWWCWQPPSSYLIYHPKHCISTFGNLTVYHNSTKGNKDFYIWNKQFMYHLNNAGTEKRGAGGMDEGVRCREKPARV
jgi:hypothetical protein